MRIPLTRSLGESLAKGVPLVEADPAYLPRFQQLAQDLRLIAGDLAAERGREA